MHRAGEHITAAGALRLVDNPAAAFTGTKRPLEITIRPAPTYRSSNDYGDAMSHPDASSPTPAPGSAGRPDAGSGGYARSGMAEPNASQAPDPGPQGRCVCGEKVTIADAREITLPNGRPGWEGYCPDCGAPLFAIRRRATAG